MQPAAPPNPPEPIVLSIIAEHSMCQPGRPSPHGDGHVGSPGFDAFQSAKSRGSFFPPPSRMPSLPSLSAMSSADPMDSGTSFP